jgi:hypothetical protein
MARYYYNPHQPDRVHVTRATEFLKSIEDVLIIKPAGVSPRDFSKLFKQATNCAIGGCAQKKQSAPTKEKLLDFLRTLSITNLDDGNNALADLVTVAETEKHYIQCGESLPIAMQFLVSCLLLTRTIRDSETQAESSHTPSGLH